MDGLEAIKDRIIEEAEESAEQVLDRAREQTARMIADAKDEAEKILSSARSQADQLKENRLNRAKSIASLEKRKDALKQRQLVVDAVISEAVKYLTGLPEEKKIAFYQDILRSHDHGSSAEVFFSRHDKAISDRVLEPFDGRFSNAGTDGSFSGGIIIRRGRIEENVTLELMIRNDRSELVQTASAILFHAEETAVSASQNPSSSDNSSDRELKAEGTDA